MSSTSHDASASALGYLYQAEWPLVEILRRGATEPDATLTIELYDDVAWEEQGTPIELLQLKHHVNVVGHLGDKDADLWRTIRVWMDAHSAGDPHGPTLTLVTTGIASAGTAADALRPRSGRDPDAARALLEAAAHESTAKDTAQTRARFLELAEADRIVFVDRMYVLDGQPTIGDDLDAQLRTVLYYALPSGHEATFMEQVWGWWRRVVVELLRRERATVNALSVKAKIDELRNSFAGDNLPTLVRREDINFDVDATYTDRPFVEQLRWIAFTARLLQQAMIDYYRAYAQTARWVEDNLVELDELADFESDLKEQWERQFEYMKLKLPPDADAATQQRAGQELFRLVTENSAVRIRAYDEPFFRHGTLHGLADNGRVGWHPAFQARLQTLLLGNTSS